MVPTQALNCLKKRNTSPYPARSATSPSVRRVSLVDLMTDFALAVRGLRVSEFDDVDAAASLAMDRLADESARLDGRRLPISLHADTWVGAERRAAIHQRLGVDPLDIEAMLSLVYPDRF